MSHVLVDNVCVICGEHAGAPHKEPTNNHQAVLAIVRYALAYHGWCAANWYESANYVAERVYAALHRIHQGAEIYEITRWFDHTSVVDTYFVASHEVPGIISGMLNTSIRLNRIEITWVREKSAQRVVNTVLVEQGREVDLQCDYGFAETGRMIVELLEEWSATHILGRR